MEDYILTSFRVPNLFDTKKEESLTSEEEYQSVKGDTNADNTPI